MREGGREVREGGMHGNMVALGREEGGNARGSERIQGVEGGMLLSR